MSESYFSASGVRATLMQIFLIKDHSNETQFLVKKRFHYRTVRFGYKERKTNELLSEFLRYLARRKFLNHKEPHVPVIFVCQHFGRKKHFSPSYLKLLCNEKSKIKHLSFFK